ncbi:MAG TPA: FdtA/QdtA family cupin domain-containing protein [Myxococcota bacterium]|nr:FdtA/QdtA family cupin domain-containing protein [Myxococcota bacterium]
MTSAASKFPILTRTDERGHLSALQRGDEAADFDVKRIYYLYGVPGDKRRGAHGHRALEQILIAISGSFDVILDDGFERRRFRLDDPREGLRVPRMYWRELENFSENAVCLVLASELHDEADYIWDYDAFVAAARGGRSP